MSLHKIIKIASIILSVVGIIYFLLILFTGEDTIKETGEYVDGYIYVSYIVLAIALLLVAIFVIKGILSGNIIKTLILVGAFLLIVAISYALTDGTEHITRDGTVITAGESRWIGTGLYVFYIIAIIAVAAMLFTGIKRVNR